MLPHARERTKTCCGNICDGTWGPLLKTASWDRNPAERRPERREGTPSPGQNSVPDTQTAPLPPPCRGQPQGHRGKMGTMRPVLLTHYPLPTKCPYCLALCHLHSCTFPYFLTENAFLEVNDYTTHLLQQAGEKQQIVTGQRKDCSSLETILMFFLDTTLSVGKNRI